MAPSEEQEAAILSRPETASRPGHLLPNTLVSVAPEHPPDVGGREGAATAAGLGRGSRPDPQLWAAEWERQAGRPLELADQWTATCCGR